VTASPPRETIRIDKWLWQARFFKSRSQATAAVAAGRVRIGDTVIARPARAVGPGDLLAFVHGDAPRVVRIVSCGQRRGPAPEAQGLYDDLSPPVQPQDAARHNPAPDGGRPTKRNRRALDAFLQGDGSFSLE